MPRNTFVNLLVLVSLTFALFLLPLLSCITFCLSLRPSEHRGRACVSQCMGRMITHGPAGHSESSITAGHFDLLYWRTIYHAPPTQKIEIHKYKSTLLKYWKRTTTSKPARLCVDISRPPPTLAYQHGTTCGKFSSPERHVRYSMFYCHIGFFYCKSLLRLCQALINRL